MLTENKHRTLSSNMRLQHIVAILLCACTLLNCANLASCAEGAAAPSAQEGSEEGSEAGVDVLAFFVIVLVIGIATYHVLAVTRIPYTALLIVSSTSHCGPILHLLLMLL